MFLFLILRLNSLQKFHFYHQHFEMGRGKTLSEAETAKIDLLIEMGWSFRKIAKKIDRSHQVVSSYVRNRENYGKNRAGRTVGAINDRDRRRILREASNSMLSTKQIKEKLDVGGSLSTIQRVIKRAPHLQRKKLMRKPALKEHHKTARLAFAEKHVSWTNQWNNVVFSDEKKFNLDGPDGYNYYFHDLRKNEQHLMSRQHGGGSVMVWGAITSKGPIELVVLNGRQKAINYLELLKNQKIKMAEKMETNSFVFQQDNAAIHTANVVKDWFQSENMRVLEWPALSPDLNIIENAWGWLSRKVFEGGRQFGTVDELVSAIHDSWNRMPMSIVKNLFGSMPKRLIEVLKKGGNATKY